jgi:hypothetical protein
MFDLAGPLKLVHALVGVLFLAGLIGRWLTLGQAARAAEIVQVRALLALSRRFELIVVTTSLFVLLLGLLTAIAQGRPFLGPLQGARIDWLFTSLVIYVSAIPLVPLVFLPRGRVFDGALEEAAAQGAVSERLRTAFDDRVVYAAHVYELGAMLVVLGLMIAKPF